MNGNGKATQLPLPTAAAKGTPRFGQEIEPARPAPLVVDVEEAARMLDVSACTVRREIDRGNLRACRLGRRIKVRVSELDAYLRRSEIR